MHSLDTNTIDKIDKSNFEATSDYWVERIYNKIPIDYKERYKKIFKEDEETLYKHIRIVYKEILDKLKINTYDSLHDFNSSKIKTKLMKDFRICRLSRNKQKRRWHAYVLDEVEAESTLKPKFILKELLENIIEDKNAFITKALEEIESWSQDNEQFILDFKYIHTMAPSQRKSALNYDIKIFTYSILENVDTSLYPFIDNPSFLDTRSFTPPSKKRAKVDSLEIQSNDNEVKYILPSSNNKKQIIYSSTSNELGNHEEYFNNNKYLLTECDLEDFKIIEYFISCRSLSFYRDKRIMAHEEDLLKFLNKPINSQYRKWLGNKIDKLYHRSLLASHVDSDKKVTLELRLLSSKEIITYRNGNKKNAYIITFGDYIYSSLIKHDTNSVYREHFDELKELDGISLIFVLQEHRINLYNANIFRQRYDYSFLAEYLHLSPSPTSKNLDIIKMCLDNYVKHKIIIASYDIDEDDFIITFIPLTEVEVKLLIKNKLALKNMINIEIPLLEENNEDMFQEEQFIQQSLL